jgi:hypothetical protein
LNLALKTDNKVNGADAGPTSPPNPDPNAMDLSAFKSQMSEAERTRMMRAGLCFRCGARGHPSRDCPEKGKPKGTTRIAELEEELKKWTSGAKRIDGEGRAEQSKNGGTQE